MKPKTLYHGSNKKIKILEPRKPESDMPENSMKAVFATDNKRRALGMALTNSKYASSFATKNPFIINFVRGKPGMKFIYLYYLSPKHFRLNREGEYISEVKVKPFKIEKYRVSKLNYLWRKSNKQELNKFLKNRK